MSASLLVEKNGRPYSPGGLDDSPGRPPPGPMADWGDKRRLGGTGDTLIFLPGEREIRDVTDAIRAHGTADIELLPIEEGEEDEEAGREAHAAPEMRLGKCFRKVWSDMIR